MKYLLLFLLLSLFLASVYSQVIITEGDDEYEPTRLFIKRNPSLSNMMRLGKRAMTIKKNCEDCHLGNLMRLGR